jgi:hypothetical protein
MNKLLLRIWIFIDLWGSPDTWSDDPNAQIDARFAWALAGPLAKFQDEMDELGESYEQISVRRPH